LRRSIVTMHALLLTDVVDSTRLAQQMGDAAMAELWATHDRLARDLLPAWRGREIDKADGMLLLFDGVDDAVGYALEYHAAIAEKGLPIQARAGIHVGSVTLRSNSAQDIARGAKALEVAGIALPTAARVMSVALGGQTLLSADARAALAGPLRRVRSQGHWQLQGLVEPIELFEILADEASFRTPADTPKAYRVLRQGELWQPVREVRNTLPAERDSFVGRQGPLLALAERFDGGARLVSVLGMGGAGKTRLVTRFARNRLGHYPGGVWFCDLSQARSVDGIFAAVAHGLELALGAAGSLTQLAQAIAGRGPCLVVLDNFEQVARHAEQTLGQWLDRAPQAQFIITTREVLGIVGEQVLALAPLATAEATELFVRRAAAVRQDSALAAADLQAIEQLVTVLDGLPLAIELAAARARVMAPRALLARMHDRFDVLLSRAGRQDRQATLRAAFDWSWELLSDPEKAALSRLSVFQGGFSFDSASAVLGRPADDMVLGLVDKSFVRQCGDERFDLLESVRDYAAQHLRSEGRFEGSGPGCEADARQRHWRHFAAIDEQTAVAERCVELNNLVAACREATAAGDAPAAAACLVGVWSALRLVGPYRAGVELAHRVESLTCLGDADRALVHWVAGSALDKLGDVEPASHHLHRGLELTRSGAANLTRARLLLVLGGRQALAGDMAAARASLDETLALALREDASPLHAAALNGLGLLMDHQSRLSEARGFYEQALVIARELGDRRMEGGLLGNLGGVFHDLGALDQARGHYELSLTLARAVGDHQWEGNAHSNLGLLYQELGKAPEARAQFDIALAMARAVGHVRLEYTVLCNLGMVLTAEGRLPEAVEHLEQAVGAAKAASDQRSEGQFRAYLALALARQGLPVEARRSLAIGEQLLVAMSDRLSHALLLCDRVEVERLAGLPAEAEVTFKRAEQLATEMSCGVDSELRRRLQALARSATA
jgi:predicted ATPase/class 3 adenylate cyclase/Tfp pilus assembly protein PilF